MRMKIIGGMFASGLVAAIALAAGPITYPAGAGFCYAVPPAVSASGVCCLFADNGEPDGVKTVLNKCDEYKQVDIVPNVLWDAGPVGGTTWRRRNAPLPGCGDGILDPTRGEQCEPGVDKGACTLLLDCQADCQCAPTTTPCGNGDIDAGESCDPPGSKAADGRTCSSTCRLPCTCDNGMVETGCEDGSDETCDFADVSGQGTAGDFAGGVVEFSDLDKIDFGANAAFTIQADICPSALPTSGVANIVYKGGTAASNIGYQMVMRANGALGLNIADGTTSGIAQSPAADGLQVGRCYGVAVTRVASSTTCNGLIKDKTPGTVGAWAESFGDGGDAVCSTAGSLAGTFIATIGGRNSASATLERFMGRIDNVRIWNAALSAAQLETIDATPPACNATSPAVLLFSASLDEGMGTTVLDCADDAGAAFTTSTGSVTGGGAFTWVPSPFGGSGESTIGSCNPSQTCIRPSCTCQTSSTSAVCGNETVELGEQCDTDGATGSCGSCSNQTLGTCCRSTGSAGGSDCQCADAGASPPFQAIHTALVWKCLQNCPPARGTCSAGASQSGIPECCSSCAPATAPSLTSTAPILNLDLANSSLSFAGGARELLNVSGAVAGKAVEVYMNGTRVNLHEASTFADGSLRNKFVLGFRACSHDWSYSCTANATCAAISAGSTCQTVAPNTGVFLTKINGGFAAEDNGANTCTCAGFDSDGTGNAACAGCDEIFFDLMHPHFRNVWVAHALQHVRNKVCTSCASPGEATPTGHSITNAQCAAACGAGSVAVPSGITRLFYDNIGDPSAAGTFAGFLPLPGSSAAVRDPAPSRCDTSVSPPVCHNGDATYDRAEYVRDLKNYLVDVTKRINDGGMNNTINVLGNYHTLKTNPLMRDAVRAYAATERRPRAELELAVFDFGTNSLREGPASTGLDIEEALDAARWLTGTTADASGNPSPNIPLVIEEARATRSARHREANMAFALLVTGDVTDTASGGRSRHTTAAHVGGNQWFDSFSTDQRDWYTSVTRGVNLLGPAQEDWECAGGASPSATDSGTHSLTGLPNCGLYRRRFQNGTVFFNAKVTVACADATITAGGANCSGSPSSCTITTGCTGTTYTSVDLDDTNEMPTSGGGCLLEGDGSKTGLTFSTTATMSIAPLGAAIIYHGACP